MFRVTKRMRSNNPDMEGERWDISQFYEAPIYDLIGFAPDDFGTN